MKIKLIIVFIVVILLWLAVWLNADTYIMPPTAKLPDGGRYFGKLENHQFTGEGKIIWPNGSSYHGSFKKGLYSGLGEFKQANGDNYKGQFVDGTLTGQGQLKTFDGHIYEGQFKNFLPNGFGKWQFEKGSSYVGYLKNGRYHGQGTLIINDGDYYIGHFEKGRYHGTGELYDSNENLYDGEFKQGMFHGKGRYVSSNGDSYEGEFEDSKLTGTGVFEDHNGNRYEGGFKQWVFDGKGKYSNSTGGYYKGEFVAGQLTGEGSYKGNNGQVYQGDFKNWSFHGKGEILQENGDRFQGEFKRGSYHGEGILTYASPKKGEIHVYGLWRYGKFVGDGNSPDPIEANTEKVLYNQNQLIQTTIDGLLPSQKNKINMYFIGVSGDGKQDVFYKETKDIRKFFDQSFATLGRSALLVNNPDMLDTIPLATSFAFERLLNGVSTKMDKENDIMFIYLTSHGSKEHEFVLDQKGLALADLPATKLAEIIKSVPIKWKVIVISACYSGGFIPELEDENTLIMTAAAHDRTSFGCSDDADMTYFGRAFFKDALPKSDSLVTAFERAKELVLEREKEIIEDDESEHSNPQISKPNAIIERLKLWRAQLLL